MSTPNITSDSNSNSSISDCTLGDRAIRVGNALHQFVFFYYLPFYYVVGIGSNIVLLIAFYRKSKTQTAYAYQVLLTTSKLIEIVVYGALLFSLFWWSGIYFPDDTAAWFVRGKFFLFFLCRILDPAHMQCILMSLLLAVAMSADRVFALTWPFVYKNIAHKKHQALAALVCFLIPIPIAFGYLGWWTYRPEGDHYLGYVDDTWFAQPYPRGAALSGISMRIVCSAALVGLNAFLIVKFRRQKAKIGHITDKKELAKKEAERTVTVLNMYQSILMCWNQIPHTFLHLFVSVAPRLDACYSPLTHPIADFCILLTDSLDLFFIMAIHKKTRQMIFKLFRRSARVKDSQGGGGQNGRTWAAASGAAPSSHHN